MMVRNQFQLSLFTWWKHCTSKEKTQHQITRKNKKKIQKSQHQINNASERLANKRNTKPRTTKKNKKQNHTLSLSGATVHPRKLDLKRSPVHLSPTPPRRIRYRRYCWRYPCHPGGCGQCGGWNCRCCNAALWASCCAFACGLGLWWGS